MTNSIFYSWQSDFHAKINRYFIRDCLDKVIKKLNGDNNMNEAVRLDQDTQGIPGTPDIANTIFKKIRESSAFVADLTLSSQSTGGKKSPNPNVLVELGYAFSAIGDSRVITVMNTAYGEPSDLPFDLNHKRWPIQYSLLESDLNDKTKITNVRNTLTDQLYTAIRLVLDKTQQTPATALDPSGPPSISYINNLISNCDPREEWGIISTDPELIAVNKRDVNLRLLINYLDEGIQCQDFSAKWANCHPDPHAIGYWCDTYYGASHVSRSVLVVVDGGRARLPLPRQLGVNGDLTEVLLLDYRIAQIFDSLGNLDGYMHTSGLSLAFS